MCPLANQVGLFGPNFFLLWYIYPWVLSVSYSGVYIWVLQMYMCEFFRCIHASPSGLRVSPSGLLMSPSGVIRCVSSSGQYMWVLLVYTYEFFQCIHVSSSGEQMWFLKLRFTWLANWWSFKVLTFNLSYRNPWVIQMIVFELKDSLVYTEKTRTYSPEELTRIHLKNSHVYT